MATLSQQDGVLYYKGTKVKLLGANTYSLYARLVNNLDPTAYQTVFTWLAASGCKVVRIFGDGFDTNSEIGLWETDPGTALAATKLLFDGAAKHDISIIWCLHWNVLSVAAWKLEANSALLSGTTASRTYLKLVVDTVVPAFKDHPALAAWECGNEINGLFPGVGLTNDNAITVQNDLRTWAAAQDSVSLISSGSNTTDLSAISGQSGQSPDTGLTFQRAMHLNWNTQSAHVYATGTSAVGLNGQNFGAWAQRTCAAAKSLNQPMLLGELGGGSSDAATSEIQIRNIVQGFVDAQAAQLALIWNCDTSDFSGNQANFIFNSTTRAYIFDLIKRHAIQEYIEKGPVLSMTQK